MKFPPSKLIAIDVDGTLHQEGIPNVKLIAWLKRRKVEGFDLMLWSARGRQHCLRAVEEFGLDGLFDVITGKPGYIVDDKGWAWIKFTKVVTNFEK